MKKKEDLIVLEPKQMVIGYFELLLLIDAAWSCGTILKHSIIVKLMDTWYHALSKNNRERVYSYIRRVLVPQQEIHQRLLARFNPDNQYRVHIDNNGDKQTPECYFYEGEYWTSSFQFANKDFILWVKQI